MPCDQADEVGGRVAAWLDRRRWTVLNDGTRTFASYHSGNLTAPDIACCSPALSQRCSWRTGPDMDSDHLPMLMEVRTSSAPPNGSARLAGPSRKPPSWRSATRVRQPWRRRCLNTSRSMNSPPSSTGPCSKPALRTYEGEHALTPNHGP